MRTSQSIRLTRSRTNSASRLIGGRSRFDIPSYLGSARLKRFLEQAPQLADDDPPCNPEFPFSILNQTRTDTGSFANAKFEPCFESKGLSTPPQRASSASR
jgi:hypothetical protein